MTWLIETIQGFPVWVKAIAYVILTVWGIEMFLLPFNVARIANRLTEIKKFLYQDSVDHKAQLEALGDKFDIANLVMSDFWKYKGELEKRQEKGDA